MLTIKDILHIPFPEEQKELKPGYTVLDMSTGEIYKLEESNFYKDRLSEYPLVLGTSDFTLNGRYNTSHACPSLIVIDVPKVPKKIRLAPALFQATSGLPFIKDGLYKSLEEAKEYRQSHTTKIIWPAPPIGPDGFYEFSEEDWK